MFKKVIVPLDGTELAAGILPYIADMASGLDTSIVLLSAIDPDAVELPERIGGAPRSGAAHLEVVGTAAGVVDVNAQTSSEDLARAGVHPHERGGPHVTQLFDKAEEIAKTRLGEIAKRLKSKVTDVDTRVVFGKPAEKIIEFAEAEGADLIAMSTHGRNMIGRGLLGSVTDKVLHATRLPVLTISPDKAKVYGDAARGITNVIVPLDGSELAEGVLPYVEDIATRMSLSVLLVRVLGHGGTFAPYSEGLAYLDDSRIDETLEAEFTDYLGGVAERFKAKGIKVAWKIMRGAPAICITDLARETSNNMIALATHGRSGLTRWVLGSVAEGVIRATGDPVLVVPPH